MTTDAKRGATRHTRRRAAALVSVARTESPTAPDEPLRALQTQDGGDILEPDDMPAEWSTTACRHTSPLRPSELEVAAEPQTASDGPQTAQARRTQTTALDANGPPHEHSTPAGHVMSTDRHSNLVSQDTVSSGYRWYFQDILGVPRHEHWQPDTPECTLCQAHFHALRRRHHCRACGTVSCDACAPEKAIVLPSEFGCGSLPQRVCYGCVIELPSAPPPAVCLYARLRS